MTLAALLDTHRPWLVLSGAGISTESGIPDYRGPDGIRRNASPMTYQEFIGSVAARRRYWARSHLGWRVIGRAEPNAGHRAVTALQRAGVVGTVITQNVDQLHQAAGTTDVIDLHGRLDRIVCLDCATLSSREDLEHRLDAANPAFAGLADQIGRVNPDGDVELSEDLVADFTVVPCEVCGGRLKPDVVFFGESVPKERVERCFTALERHRALLVLGSSLTVMSGYRFVRRAHREGWPVVIINHGPTRGDAEATRAVDATLGTVLPALAAELAAA